MNLRSLLAFGTGVGIQIQARDLEVTVVRVRPGRTTVLGNLRITGFRQRPAAEWGSEYADFLRRMGAGHLAAAVLLPRSEVIVRQLLLPGVAERDLESAIPLQIDSLHPYGEDEAQYGWARLPGSSAVLVAVAHKKVVERYSQLFQEAGIKIASFTVSAAAMYSASRVLTIPASDGFLAIGGDESEVEAYGESPARPMLSAMLVPPVEKSASLAAAELRLEQTGQWLELADLLPKPRTAPDEFDLSRSVLSYATAVTGALPRRALRANLLPVELRSTSSRVFLVPTVVLATLLLVLAIALGAQGTYEERRQLSLLRGEIARYEPSAKKAEGLAKAAARARSRAQLLDSFQRRSTANLDALGEITSLLAPPAWLNGLEIDGNTITITGQIDQAAPLLKLLDSSPFFQNSEFVGQIGRSGPNEVFRIRTRREKELP